VNIEQLEGLSDGFNSFRSKMKQCVNSAVGGEIVQGASAPDFKVHRQQSRYSANICIRSAQWHISIEFYNDLQRVHHLNV